jgi:hypothetical protein
MGIVGLCGASGSTPCWVLLMVYVWYCCWLCCASGKHTLLGIVVGLWGASDNTLYWVGLLCNVSGNALYWASLGLMWAAFINGFKIIFKKNNSRKVKMSVSVSPPKLLKRISPHKQNHMALLSSFLINLYKRATIRQISYSQRASPKPSYGLVYASPTSCPSHDLIQVTFCPASLSNWLFCKTHDLIFL